MRWQTKNHPAVKVAVSFRRASVRTKLLLVLCSVALLDCNLGVANEKTTRMVASWYGEPHRGRLMANGKKFNPDRLTAASWFYALGTKVRVTNGSNRQRSVVVTITDRGPAWQLVRNGRLIDLSHAAFRQLAHPGEGLVEVKLEPVR